MSEDEITRQLQHKSIRHFTKQSVADALIKTLIDVAQHTATSHYLQSFSVISITDSRLRAQIAQISGQQYVAENGHLFIFVIDQHRAALLAKQPQLQELGSTDKFLQGASDALLAAQNTVNAAESLGLGTVLLGSILNDAKRLIALLHLPTLTFPIIGLIVGYPDQKTQAKPRMPQAAMHFTNGYNLPAQFQQDMQAYDEVIAHYYATRLTNQRAESFSHLLTRSATTSPKKRSELLSALHQQGFLTTK
ncbi:NADPH-dependent oxidoreductase [Lacticaseibacillus baoqingensis]|uniref:NADPH-dependent oxidoreductase n=1 Tax=Lacticaseibacillus baoqingensis TaxID=2486013 RepID=A0ABW4E429_9LACO|nr:NADPH-dependent oxidoreductase [Lacticaseibacillus baoqingensis]